ncbi:MAG TPA: hypothetical protein VGF16_13665 [Bryobacteraceae bacterium]|jgi:hypothetical protein
MQAVKIHRKWARWCCWLAAASFLLLGSAAGVTLWFDPYQIYHPIRGVPPRFNVYLQRFFVPGLARTAKYQIAIAGTSFLQNIPNSRVQALCGAPAVNLCLAGASIHEEAQVLRLVLRHPGTKMAILTLDYNSFSGGSNGPVVGSDTVFPAYLYDDSIFDKFPYLLSLDSLRTIDRFRHAPLEPGETLNADWPWKFSDSTRFDAASAVSGIDPRNINRKFGMTNLTLETLKSGFATNMFPLLSTNHGVKVHFVFPPYSILVWHDYAQRDQIRTYFEFKRWLVEQAERLGTFDIIDYQDRADIITNLSLYADLYHYNEKITEEVVRGACAGEAVLTRDNFDSRTRSLLQLVKSSDPVEIVNQARSGSTTP